MVKVACDGYDASKLLFDAYMYCQPLAISEHACESNLVTSWLKRHLSCPSTFYRCIWHRRLVICSARGFVIFPLIGWFGVHIVLDAYFRVFGFRLSCQGGLPSTCQVWNKGNTLAYFWFFSVQTESPLPVKALLLSRTSSLALASFGSLALLWYATTNPVFKACHVYCLLSP